MGTTRYIYNKCVEHQLAQQRSGVDTKELTSLFITKKNRQGTLNTNIPEWTFDTPKDIRKGAVRDLAKAYKTAFSQLKSGTIRRFQFKTKKELQSVEIPDSAITVEQTGFQIFPTYKLGTIKASKREMKKLPVVDHFCRLQLRNNEWYLVVPVKKRSRDRPRPKCGTCALDPGVRTFQTLYSQEKVVKINRNAQTVEKLHKKMDTLRAARNVRQYACKRRIRKNHRKLTNMTTELHYQTIQQLKQFEVILLPVFESQRMVRGSLPSSTKRNMNELSHYLFQSRLIDSLRLDRYSNVHIVNEAYTTQTCGHCGTRKKVGSAETYKCDSCGLVIDRDVNAARNILLKHLK